MSTRSQIADLPGCALVYEEVFEPGKVFVEVPVKDGFVKIGPAGANIQFELPPALIKAIREMEYPRPNAEES